MRRIAILLALIAAGPALAHPGHLADVAGHDHWVAGAAIGLAIALGLWGALKGKGRTDEEAEGEAAEEDEGEEAPA